MCADDSARASGYADRMRWTVPGLYMLALACGPGSGTSTGTESASTAAASGGTGGGSTTSGDPTGTTWCHLPMGGVITAEMFEKMCAVSLLPGG